MKIIQELIQILSENSKPLEQLLKSTAVSTALKNGYHEIEDFLSGKIDISGFIEFIDNMSMSSPENSQEQRVHRNLIGALRDVQMYMERNGSLSKEDVNTLNNAIENLSLI